MISQREARRLKKRVDQLEAALSQQRRRYASDWPGGEFIDHVSVPNDTAMTSIKVARQLGHGVVAIDHDGKIKFFAIKLPTIT